MNLLLVDDDQTFSDVLARALVKRGYNVLTAYNVAGAESLLENFCPGFAILDLRMPGDSGLQLIPKLLERNKLVRIVIVTGYASIATAIEAIKLGATHYLTKPADADEIVAAFDYKGGKNKTTISDTP